MGLWTGQVTDGQPATLPDWFREIVRNQGIRTRKSKTVYRLNLARFRSAWSPAYHLHSK